MTCEVCGCTDDMACIDLTTGLPCHWAEEDLCSVCAKGGLALRSWKMVWPQEAWIGGTEATEDDRGAWSERQRENNPMEEGVG